MSEIFGQLIYTQTTCTLLLPSRFYLIRQTNVLSKGTKWLRTANKYCTGWCIVVHFLLFLVNTFKNQEEDRNPARNNVAIQESVVWMDFEAVKCNISSRVDMQHYLVLCKVIIWPPLGFSHLSPKEMKRNKSYIHTSRSTI